MQQLIARASRSAPCAGTAAPAQLHLPPRPQAMSYRQAQHCSAESHTSVRCCASGLRSGLAHPPQQARSSVQRNMHEMPLAVTVLPDRSAVDVGLSAGARHGAHMEAILSTRLSLWRVRAVMLIDQPAGRAATQTSILKSHASIMAQDGAN